MHLGAVRIGLFGLTPLFLASPGNQILDQVQPPPETPPTSTTGGTNPKYNGRIPDVLKI